MNYNIEVKGFMGVLECTAHIINPVTIITGDNAQGKSSLARAIGALLSRETNPMGVQTRFLPQYINSTNRQAVMKLFSDRNGAVVEWKLASQSKISEFGKKEDIPYSSPIAVGIEMPTNMPIKERGKILAEIVNPLPTLDQVREAMDGQGLSEKAIVGIHDRIITSKGGGKSGWDNCSEFYRELRRSQKAQWELITGKRYGDEKSITWMPDGFTEEMRTKSVEWVNDQLSTAKLEMDEANNLKIISEENHEAIRSAYNHDLPIKRSSIAAKGASVHHQENEIARINPLVKEGEERVRVLNESIVKGEKSRAAKTAKKNIADATASIEGLNGKHAENQNKFNAAEEKWQEISNEEVAFFNSLTKENNKLEELLSEKKNSTRTMDIISAWDGDKAPLTCPSCETGLNLTEEGLVSWTPEDKPVYEGRELSVIDTEYEECKTLCISLKKQKDDLKPRFTEQSNIKAGAKSMMDDCESQVKELKGKIAELQMIAANTGSETDVSDLEGQLETVGRDLATDRKARDDANQELGRLQAQIEDAGAFIDKATADYEELEEYLVQKAKVGEKDTKTARHEHWTKMLKASNQYYDATRIFKSIVGFNFIINQLDEKHFGSLKSRVMHGGITVINQKMSEVCKECDFDSLFLDDEYGFTWGGRDIKLCSNSEQWRAQAVFAYAVAIITNSSTVVLDEADILDYQNEGKLAESFGKIFNNPKNKMKLIIFATGDGGAWRDIDNCSHFKMVGGVLRGGNIETITVVNDTEDAKPETPDNSIKDIEDMV